MSADRRYAAKLLFQTRHVPEERDRRRRRMCEERTFLVSAPSARLALARALRRGRSLRHHYTNVAGQPVHYEFVGVMQLLHIDPSYYEPDEVWMEFVYRKTPMERRDALIPAHDQLDAIRHDPPA